MADFFICSIKSPQCTDKNSKNMLIEIFLLCVLMNQKRGVPNRETKNVRLGMIVTSFQDLKFLGKQISPTFSYKQRKVYMK